MKTNNPNKCKSPLGLKMYHFGGFCAIKQHNQYISFNYAEIKRKPSDLELRNGVHIRRATRVHIFGKAANFDFNEADRMFDVLYYAWSSRIVGSAFTLRVASYLLEMIYDKKGESQKNYFYCQSILNSIKRQLKLRQKRHRLAA
jgi:hypothetical protein